MNTSVSPVVKRVRLCLIAFALVFVTFYLAGPRSAFLLLVAVAVQAGQVRYVYDDYGRVTRVESVRDRQGGAKNNAVMNIDPVGIERDIQLCGRLPHKTH